MALRAFLISPKVLGACGRQLKSDFLILRADTADSFGVLFVADFCLVSTIGWTVLLKQALVLLSLRSIA